MSDLKDSDNIQFEDFYEIMCRWAISPEQTELDYVDFAAADEKPGVYKSNVNDFKKMTDRVV